MIKPMILDCTLRDGGYINDWAFGKRTIQRIIQHMNKANIDIVEVGFLENTEYNENISVFSDVKQIAPFISPKQPGTLYVAMIALGDISPEKIAPYDGSSIDGIRLTFHKHEWESAKQVAQVLIEKGYQVFIQPVGTTAYSDAQLLHLIQEVNKLHPYALYLVDTLGILYRHDMLRFFYLIDHNLDKDIRVGFHSHNNLQLSFSNAQELMRMESTRQIIIDTSVYGMGRGVGNLATELLAAYINENLSRCYALSPLLDIADQDLMPIYAQQRWGYDLPYFLSAVEKCHPNYAAYLLNKGTLTADNMSKILGLIPEEKRDLFNKALIESLYSDFQACQIDDSSVIKSLRCRLNNRNILVIASGYQVQLCIKKINNYIVDHSPIVISVNHIPEQISIDILFISNRKRLAKMDLSGNIDVIASSNLCGMLPEISHYINYTNYLGEGGESDNAGAMLIRVLKQIGVKHIALAGFDGFAMNTSVYADSSFVNTQDRDVLARKNQDISHQIKSALEGISFEFITPTRYDVT